MLSSSSVVTWFPKKGAYSDSQIAEVKNALTSPGWLDRRTRNPTANLVRPLLHLSDRCKRPGKAPTRGRQAGRKGHDAQVGSGRKAARYHWLNHQAPAYR